MSGKEKSDSVENCEFRMPQDGDKAFLPSGDWSRDAYIDESAYIRRGALVLGYKSAGDKLVEFALSDALELNTLIYPIIFCYRHYLELSIKWMIEVHGLKIGAKPIVKSHDLRECWLKLKNMFDEYSLPDEDNYTEIVERIIFEFDHIDQNNINFRYHKDNNFEDIEIPAQSIDIGNLRSVINCVENYFSGIDGYLSDCKF